jgi:hypothetical protein
MVYLLTYSYVLIEYEFFIGCIKVFLFIPSVLLISFCSVLFVWWLLRVHKWFSA